MAFAAGPRGAIARGKLRRPARPTPPRTESQNQQYRDPSSVVSMSYDEDANAAGYAGLAAFGPDVSAPDQAAIGRLRCRSEREAFVLQQPALAIETAAIAGERAVGADDTMTGHHDADWIGA